MGNIRANDAIQTTQHELLAAYQSLPEHEPETTYEIRRHILSSYVLLSELSPETTPDTANFEWWSRRAIAHTGKGMFLGPQQQIDVLELMSGQVPRRHDWVHDTQEKNIATKWGVFRQHIEFLESSKHRDFELEHATVEIASRLLMVRDENGQPHLQDTTVYVEEIYTFGEDGAEPIRVIRQDELELDAGSFIYGKAAGFKDDHADYWFVVSNGKIAPLNRIYGLDFGQAVAPAEASK